jgi:hypothetical protein
MRKFNSLTDFYNSDEWRNFRQIVISERLTSDGFTIDEHTGKQIVRAYDIILHHKEPLTEDNMNDVNISLNPQNIMIVSHKTHNIIHNKLGYACRQVFLVYGAPLSGKTSYVRESMSEGDLIIDVDNIWQCVTGCDRYVKPNRLKSVVFKIRDCLIESVKYRFGKWNNAYLIGGYPLQSERERLIKELGAREIYIEASREECMERLKKSEDARGDDWEKYIDEWFDKYTRPLS